MIAIVDTNVWISGALNKDGIPAKVIDAWLNNQFELLMSPDLLGEIRRVFTYPRILKSKSYDSDRVHRLLESLERSAHLIDAETTQADFVVRDPKDRMILALARAGGADYIVSGDDDLHAVGSYAGSVVLYPSTMVKVLQALSEDA